MPSTDFSASSASVERLIEVVVDEFRPEQRQGLAPGTWVHELVHNAHEGFFIAYRYRLEGEEEVEHFSHPDHKVELVQGAWQRCVRPKRPVEITKLQAVAEVFGERGWS